MLDRPPGGATILWVERRGMWSSIWVPGQKNKKMIISVSLLSCFLLLTLHWSDYWPENSTCEGESRLVEISGASQGFWTWGPPGGRGGWDWFSHADDIMDWTIVVSTGDTASFGHLKREEINLQITGSFSLLDRWRPLTAGYLATGFDSLVHDIRKSLPGNEASWTFGHVEFSVLQKNSSAADHHRCHSPKLQTLKDVDL